MFYSVLRFFLFLLPAEFSHHISLKLLKLFYNLRLLPKPKTTPVNITRHAPDNVFLGLDFPGKVGLAAGLDKNGDYIDTLANLGFDFIEIGTVTPLPQQGNPKPRLFRLKQHGAIINRMGFNNKGVDYLVEQVKHMKYQGILGINIGKNKNTANENALDDYLICMEKVYAYASYITINLSSPNTPGLRDLQLGEALERLLSALKKHQHQLSQSQQKYVPLVVKISPDLDRENLKSIADILIRCEIDGVIATNTTLDKSLVETHKHGTEQGGLSGFPVRDRATTVIKVLAEYLDKKIPIIGVGGINNAQAAKEKLEAGASLLQLYTGFIYKGPGLIQQIKKALN